MGLEIPFSINTDYKSEVFETPVSFRFAEQFKEIKVGDMGGQAAMSAEQKQCHTERKLFCKSSSLKMTLRVGYLRIKVGNLWQDSSKLISGLSLPLSFASKNCIVHFGDTARSDVRGIPV